MDAPLDSMFYYSESNNCPLSLNILFYQENLLKIFLWIKKIEVNKSLFKINIYKYINFWMVELD